MQSNKQLILEYATSRGLDMPTLRDVEDETMLYGTGMNGRTPLVMTVAEELGIAVNNTATSVGGDRFGVLVLPEMARLPDSDDDCPNRKLITDYAVSRGLVSVELSRSKFGWRLHGSERTGDDKPLVWEVCRELGISYGVGDSTSHQIRPDKAKLPEMTAAQKLEALRADLAMAMEVLPAVIDSITEYTLESLEPYAHRLLLAGTILHSIERKLDECYRGEDDDAEDEGDEEDEACARKAVPSDLWDNDEYTEADRDRAVATLGGLK